MSRRQARWLLFAVLVLTVPYPMLALTGPFMPTIGYLLLSGGGLAVMLVEGASVTVRLVVLLFSLHALAGLALSWGVAWIVSRLLPDGLRRGFVLGFCLVLLASAFAFELYVTPYHRLPSGNLWVVLT